MIRKTWIICTFQNFVDIKFGSNLVVRNWILANHVTPGKALSVYSQYVLFQTKTSTLSYISIFHIQFIHNMFLPEEVDWQFYNQLKPKFLFLPYITSILPDLFPIYRDFHKVTEVRMNLMYITFYHFWFWILATGQQRCLKWERKMSAQNFWSQKVVHFIFQSFDSISLKQTYCILYGKYCSVKCRKRIRKFLQKQILSERTFLVIHTRSLFSPPSANKLR